MCHGKMYKSECSQRVLNKAWAPACMFYSTLYYKCTVYCKKCGDQWCEYGPDKIMK